MCPRPRRIDDHTLITAAVQVVGERGAARTRLSDVAAASGLAPATLVQRFGSREGMLEAVSEALLHDLRAAFQSAELPPLANLAMALSHITTRRHLAFLLARTGASAAWSLELRKQIGFSLIGALDQGELPPCDVARLARRVQLDFFGAATAAHLEGAVLDAETIARLIADAAAGV